MDYDGTLIVVSHDRDFLDGLVTKVYEFGHQRVREHLCGVYEFLETRRLENLQELEDDGEIYESIEDIWPDYPTKEDFFFDEEEY